MLKCKSIILNNTNDIDIESQNSVGSICPKLNIGMSINSIFFIRLYISFPHSRRHIFLFLNSAFFHGDAQLGIIF